MSIWLVRHGETEWSRAGRHTGMTDLPLTAEGRLQAAAIGALLRDRVFAHVLTSPRLRALETARLAGFGDRARASESLVEVDYGELEGLTTPEIRERHAGWQLFRDGSPGGESPAAVADRVDALLTEVAKLEGAVLMFGHGHCLRSVAVRFLGLPIDAAARMRLDAGSISVLTHERDGPSISLWNRRVPARAVLVAKIAARLPEEPG